MQTPFLPQLLTAALSQASGGAGVSPILIAVICIVAAVAAVFILRTVATRSRHAKQASKPDHSMLGTEDFSGAAAKIIEGLGGKDNLSGVSVQADAVLAEIRDFTAVDEKTIRESGVSGIQRPSKTQVKMTLGSKAKATADALQKLIA